MAGLSPNICYAIEGNVVDRVSAKNGKGWYEGVSPTLNTQDRHAVVYALEGNGARPSHQGCGYSDDGKMYTLNTIEQHAVCYDARGNGTGDIVSTLTGDHQNRITDYTAVVCYESLSEQDWLSVREQSSGKLLRAGRVQRHADCD